MTEQKAIEGCKKQDRISQKHIFDAYSEAMLMLCMRYVKSLPDAEELMLNGFFSFYRTIDRFIYGGPGAIGAWLKKIMVNECLMFLRKAGTLTIVEEGYGAEATTGHGHDEQLSAAEIFKVVMTLPDGYRTVFNLYVVEGYTHKEIGGLLGISEGTSKSQLAKAKETLQKLLKLNGIISK